MAHESQFVQAGWLANHLVDPAVVIIDCRFELTRPDVGRGAYAAGHIPGAFYFDLEGDMSGPKQAHGGRHPLPDLAAFAAKVGNAGIDGSVTVVAYDGQKGSNAARLWWMLRYLGHPRTLVLDGGWTAWREGGYPVSSEAPRRSPRTFTPRPRPGLLVGLDELRRRMGGGGVRVVDSRAPERYRGEVEPLDPVAGHIPGAANLPWTDNVDGTGHLKPIEWLKERFAGLASPPAEVIVYCGSGVTACANLMAMEEAGLSGARLYLGGWSDWCSYPENPVAKE
jgi:thiosulfate/3-mercaptopyruvate sulfurtransferase